VHDWIVLGNNFPTIYGSLKISKGIGSYGTSKFRKVPKPLGSTNK